MPDRSYAWVRWGSGRWHRCQRRWGGPDYQWWEPLCGDGSQDGRQSPARSGRGIRLSARCPGCVRCLRMLRGDHA